MSTSRAVYFIQAEDTGAIKIVRNIHGSDVVALAALVGKSTDELLGFKRGWTA